MVKVLERNQKEIDYLTNDNIGIDDIDADSILAKYEDDALWEEKFLNADGALKRLLVDVMDVDVTKFNRNGMAKREFDV